MPVVERSTIDGLYLYEVPEPGHVTDPRYWRRVECCTVWEVHIGYPVNRCGKCKQRPTYMLEEWE